MNAVTGESIWATPENDYLCPPPPPSPTKPLYTHSYVVSKPDPVASGASSRQVLKQPVANSDSKQASNPSRPVLNKSSVASGSAKEGSVHCTQDNGLQIALNQDEVVLESPGGRKFIFNKRTRQSRWLSQESRKSEDAISSAPGSNQSVASLSRDRRAKINGSERVRSSTEAAVDLQRAYRSYVVRRKDVMSKLKTLANMQNDVTTIISSGGKYDLDTLRAALQSSAFTPGDQMSTGIPVREADQRLLELDEYLTQKNLAVDGVDSVGDSIVRLKRKETVNLIQQVMARVDFLRKITRASR